MTFSCPGCGNEKTSSKEVKRHHYVESGLDDVFLLGGVHIIKCTACGGEFRYVPDEQQLLQVIAIVLLAGPAPLSGAAQTYLRKTCDLTQAQLAKLLGISRRETIAEREKSNAPMPLDAEFRFRAIVLTAFWEYLRVGHNSYLAPDHFVWLARVRESFLTLARRDSRRTAKVEIRRTEGSIWSTAPPDDRPAAATAAA